MTVTPLDSLDIPKYNGEAQPGAFDNAFLRALDAAGDALVQAGGAERNFVAGNGGLQEMVLERAQADILLAVAAAAASRTAGALTTILGMQV